MNEKDIALLKKDLYIGIISNGSTEQKNNVLRTASDAFDFCTSHLEKASPDAPRRGRPKNADK